MTKYSKSIELCEYEKALITYIWAEIGRIYWNYEQKEFDSVYGTSEVLKEFKKVGISWTPYNWDESKEPPPNLVLGNISFWWYKYFGRGMTKNSQELLTKDWFDGIIKKLDKIDD